MLYSFMLVKALEGNVRKSKKKKKTTGFKKDNTNETSTDIVDPLPSL